MSTHHNPLARTRRLTGTALAAATLAVGGLSLHLAQDQSATTSATSTSGSSSDTSDSGTTNAGTTNSGTTSGSTSNDTSSGFGPVGSVQGGSGSAPQAVTGAS